MEINRMDYDLSNGEHRIMVDGYKTLIGKYETKERALEILDEIQEHIEKHGETYLEENGVKHYGNVYQMPSE